jgi:hypothetical protein
VDALRGVGVQQIACGSGHTVILTAVCIVIYRELYRVVSLGHLDLSCLLDCAFFLTILSFISRYRKVKSLRGDVVMMGV